MYEVMAADKFYVPKSSSLETNSDEVRSLFSWPPELPSSSSTHKEMHQFKQIMNESISYVYDFTGSKTLNGFYEHIAP